MEVVEKRMSWERRMPQRITVIVAVTVKRGERAMEEEEEDEDKRGQLIFDIRYCLIKEGT
jgi:hypothetical protein